MASENFYNNENGRVENLAALTRQVTDLSGLSFAADVRRNVPLYDVAALSASLADPVARRQVLAEWAQILGPGAGVLVLKGAYPKPDVIDDVTEIFYKIIAQDKQEAGAKSDHFAVAGANDRIWNAHQKLCLADPVTYCSYVANPAISAVCEAWLGPGYQMTAQVNLVRPGGQAQEAHRDYHLGFQSAEQAARFPAHAHAMSAGLTLQGAIAHCDMPLDSGPTMLLPFSQTFPEGYMAYRRPEFRRFFAEHAIQLPLEKGDALFFNPALFHAAGENKTSDINRVANLLQISSAFGRAMENLDRMAMATALYPVLRGDKYLNAMEKNAAIAATAEGYAFPTNLDTDPPLGGLAPQSQADLMQNALAHDMEATDFIAKLTAQDIRRGA